MSNKSLVSIIGLALTPFFVASLVLLVAYRFICHLWLKYTHTGYAGLLDATENCTCDHPKSVNLYVVNVFLNVRPTNVESFEEFRRAVINKMNRTYSKKKNEKVKWIMRKFCGLRFWQKKNFDAEEQIIVFDAANFKESQDYMSTVANKKIRKNRMFEVHVGRNLIDGNYPLFFRFHHVLGDGYALRRFILDGQVSQSNFHNAAPKIQEPKKSFWKILMDNIISAADVIKMAMNSPKFCLQLYLRPYDENSLIAEDEGDLSGEKILRWLTEEFRKMKEIKRITKNTVTELILMAISKSLDDMFRSRGESVPYVTFTFIKRKTQDSSGIVNEYQPACFKMPVKTDDREKCIVQRVRDLDTLPAYKCNFYLPRYLMASYPMEIPDWTLDCTEFTAFLSNVPGPDQKIAYEGFEVEECMFFGPNVHKRNGLGFMCVTYVDKIVYSVVIDKTLTRSKEDAQKLVDGMVQYIDVLKLLMNA